MPSVVFSRERLTVVDSLTLAVELAHCAAPGIAYPSRYVADGSLREQLDAILRIQSEYGLDALPEKLHEAALLRIANPEASLADLAKLSCPSVTKSTLNYRLKKIVEFRPEEPDARFDDSGPL